MPIFNEDRQIMIPWERKEFKQSAYNDDNNNNKEGSAWKGETQGCIKGVGR